MWDTGELLTARNNAIVVVGHGRLRRRCGDYMDIGGSTGGGSRRIIDSWQPPDWREFLEDEQEGGRSSSGAACLRCFSACILHAGFCEASQLAGRRSSRGVGGFCDPF